MIEKDETQKSTSVSQQRNHLIFTVNKKNSLFKEEVNSSLMIMLVDYNACCNLKTTKYYPADTSPLLLFYKTVIILLKILKQTT